MWTQTSKVYFLQWSCELLSISGLSCPSEQMSRTVLVQMMIGHREPSIPWELILFTGLEGTGGPWFATVP